MSNTVISVENLSKTYQLGQIGTGTLSRDLEVWWARLRGKPNPFLKIGEKDHGNRQGETLWALRDVSFTVEQGEVLGIIGRNGAGKSTLLKILSRVTAPSSGAVKAKGRIASLLEVGTGFHPELTGRENIFLNGAILGMSKKEVECKLDEIVAFAEVEKFLDTPVKRYSSGMYVRLAFAVAAHLEPEILVVDEVLAVGDAEFQKKCLGKIGDVAKEGRTVLFVSHNMAAIKYLCKNRVIILHKGNLLLDDLPEIVIPKYLSSFGEERTSPVRDLTKAGRKMGSLEVFISQIRLLNNKQIPENEFSVWEPFKIEITANATSDQRTSSFWILIYSSDGEVVLSLFQADCESGITITSNGIRGIVQIDPNFLTPGQYSISVGIFGKQNEFYDWIENAIQFEIIREFNTGKPYDQRLGKTTFKYRWNVENCGLP